MAPTLPPYNFYSKFFTRDCEDLDPEVLEELFTFLEKVQKNPYSPDFRGMEKRGLRYAAEFSRGFVIYWRLRESSPGHVESIDVSKLAKVADLI